MTTGLKLGVFALIVITVLGILALLPQIDIDPDAVTTSEAWAWVIAACYFIPIHTISNILTVVVGLGVFSIIVAVVKTIWSLLPFS